MANIRRGIKTGFLVLGIIVVEIICLEVFFRVFMPFEKICIDKEPAYRFKLSNNRKKGYELRPCIEDNNSDGLRDFEHSVEKPTDTRRVLIIGDSIAYGVGVNKDQTYAKKLEKILNQKSNVKYEVINLGVPGYGTVQTVEHFKEKGLKYSPDIVIYGYWFNDYTQRGGRREFEFFNTPQAAAWEFYASALQKYDFLQRMRKIILNSELLKRVLYIRGVRPGKNTMGTHPEFKHRVLRIPSTRCLGSVPIFSRPDPYVQKRYDEYLKCVRALPQGADRFVVGKYLNPEGFKDFYNALSELSLICRDQSIELIVFTTPILTSFSSYPYKNFHGFANDLCKEFDIKFIDTFNEFVKNPVSEYKINPSDICHFNEKGHEIVAKKLAKEF